MFIHSRKDFVKQTSELTWNMHFIEPTTSAAFYAARLEIAGRAMPGVKQAEQ